MKIIKVLLKLIYALLALFGGYSIFCILLTKKLVPNFWHEVNRRDYNFIDRTEEAIKAAKEEEEKKAILAPDLTLEVIIPNEEYEKYYTELVMKE